MSKLEYISTKTAAAELDLDLSTIQKWIKQGKIKAYKLGKGWRILKPDFEEWKKRNLVEV